MPSLNFHLGLQIMHHGNLTRPCSLRRGIPGIPGIVRYCFLSLYGWEKQKITIRGVATEFERGERIVGRWPTYPKYPKNRKMHRIWAVLFSNLEGTSPPKFFPGGDASPPSPSPAFDAHDNDLSGASLESFRESAQRRERLKPTKMRYSCCPR